MVIRGGGGTGAPNVPHPLLQTGRRRHVADQTWFKPPHKLANQENQEALWPPPAEDPRHHLCAVEASSSSPSFFHGPDLWKHWAPGPEVLLYTPPSSAVVQLPERGHGRRKKRRARRSPGESGRAWPRQQTQQQPQQQTQQQMQQHQQQQRQQQTQHEHLQQSLGHTLSSGAHHPQHITRQIGTTATTTRSAGVLPRLPLPVSMPPHRQPTTTIAHETKQERQTSSPSAVAPVVSSNRLPLLVPQTPRHGNRDTQLAWVRHEPVQTFAALAAQNGRTRSQFSSFITGADHRQRSQGPQPSASPLAQWTLVRSAHGNSDDDDDDDGDENIHDADVRQGLAMDEQDEEEEEHAALQAEEEAEQLRATRSRPVVSSSSSLSRQPEALPGRRVKTRTPRCFLWSDQHIQKSARGRLVFRPF